MVCRVEHLGDKKRPDEENDDVLKATANEVVATIKELLKVNPLAKETLQVRPFWISQIATLFDAPL